MFKKMKFNEKSKLHLFFIYTLLFLVILLLGFLPIFLGHYDSVNKYDGASQYLPFLAGFQEQIKNLIDSSQLYSSWDWSSGLGTSNFDRYLYYNIGDVFSYFSIFVSKNLLPYYFTLVVFTRMYLSGISVIVYLNNKKGASLSNIVGGIVYAFNIYLLFNTLLNPIFINALILLPLVLTGVDILLEKKKSQFLVIMSIITLISNFYFASIIALTALVYVIIQYFGNYKNKFTLKEFTTIFIKPVLYITGLSSFFVLPLLYTVSIMSRTSDIFSNGLVFYNLKYYFNILSSLFVFTDPNSNYWMLGSINLVAIFSFVFILRRFKANKVISLSILTSLVFLCSPILTSLLAGGGSPVLRWFFVFHFISAVSVVVLIDNYKLIEKKDINIFLLFVTMVFLLNFVGSNFNFTSNSAILIMLLLFIITMINYRNKSTLISIILLFSTLNMLLFLSPIGFNYLEKYYPEKGLSSEMLTDYYPKELMGITAPEERIAFTPNSLTSLTLDIQNYSGNFSSLYDIYTTRSYNSIQNNFFFDLLNNKLEYNQNKTLISSENSIHPEFLRFLGVKYLVLPESYEDDRIYKESYSKIDNHVVYSLDRTVPFIYSNDSTISTKDADKLSPYEIIDSFNDSIIYGDSTNNPEKIRKDESVSFELVANEEVKKIENNNFILEKDKVYKVDFKEFVDDNYYYFIELNGLEKITYSLKESYAKSGVKNDLYNKGLFLKDNILNYDTKSYSMLINDGQKDNYISSRGINGINGYSPMNPFQYRIYPNNEITIKNNSDGNLKLNGLTIKKHKKNDIPPINNPAKNIKISGDIVTANIDMANDGILATKIPYNKGWSLYVDDEKVPTELVNYAFVGAKLSEGKHSIRLEFNQYGFKYGLIISLVSLILIIIFEGYLFLKKRQR